MLTKLNDIYNKLIFENSEDQWIRKITKDSEFFDNYLKPLFDVACVEIVKARLNTFRIGGWFKDLKIALEKFKVDKFYWDDEILGKPFTLYSPMIIFGGDVTHFMNRDEGYPVDTVDCNSLYASQNRNRAQMEGRWYEPKVLDYKKLGFDYPVRAKSATPVELIKMIEVLMEEQNRNPEFTFVVVEFVLNCENLCNQVYDEETTFVPVTASIDEEGIKETDVLVDRINDVESKDVKPTAVCELPKENTENNVKIPTTNKSGKISMKKAYINSYDSKNKFKKTIKEIK